MLQLLQHVDEVPFWKSSHRKGWFWSWESVAQHAAASEVWVLREGIEIVTFLVGRSHGQAFEILYLETHPLRQRRGWARVCLLNLAQTRMEDEFWLEVSEQNRAASELYKQMGFQEVGRREQYYSDGSAARLMSANRLKLLAFQKPPC